MWHLSVPGDGGFKLQCYKKALQLDTFSPQISPSFFLYNFHTPCFLNLIVSKAANKVLCNFHAEQNDPQFVLITLNFPFVMLLKIKH